MSDDRWVASIPTDDPRFAALLTVLRSARGRGRYSPAPRMLAEWALLGYLLVSGKIAIGSVTDDLMSAQQDYSALQSAQEHVSDALSAIEWE